MSTTTAPIPSNSSTSQQSAEAATSSSSLSHDPTVTDLASLSASLDSFADLSFTSSNLLTNESESKIKDPNHQESVQNCYSLSSLSTASSLMSSMSGSSMFNNIQVRRILAANGLDIEPSNMHKILENLYLGNFSSSEDKEALTNCGIKYILNMAQELDNCYPNDFEYKNIRIDDDESEDISKHFDDATDFIHKARSSNQAILVHCMAGVSRSSSMVLAYLMKYEHMTLLEAYKHTRSRRNCIEPNPGFLGRLIRLEFRLFNGKTTMSVSRYLKLDSDDDDDDEDDDDLI